METTKGKSVGENSLLPSQGTEIQSALALDRRNAEAPAVHAEMKATHDPEETKIWLEKLLAKYPDKASMRKN